MSIAKPEEKMYSKWLKENQNIDLDAKLAHWHDSLAVRLDESFENSPFWRELVAELNSYNQEYYSQKGYYLLTDLNPKLNRKSFESLISKTYRKNIKDNPQFPAPPDGGWYLPHNWYSRIKDTVRTLFVVKYLDGAKFLSEKIRLLANKHNFRFEVYYEARDEGYYAAHINLTGKFELPKLELGTEIMDITLEVQITTQLQEVIRKLLHRYYESRRIALGIDEASWKWDYKSEEFAISYLGHILHYVEGMIMEIRDRQERKT